MLTTEQYVNLQPTIRAAAYGFIGSMGRDRDVHDLTQAGMLRLWEKRAMYEPAEDPRHWAVRVVRRLFTDMTRRRLREVRVLDTLAVMQEGYETALGMRA